MVARDTCALQPHLRLAGCHHAMPLVVGDVAAPHNQPGAIGSMDAVGATQAHLRRNQCGRCVFAEVHPELIELRQAQGAHSGPRRSSHAQARPLGLTDLHPIDLQPRLTTKPKPHAARTGSAQVRQSTGHLTAHHDARSPSIGDRQTIYLEDHITPDLQPRFAAAMKLHRSENRPALAMQVDRPTTTVVDAQLAEDGSRTLSGFHCRKAVT